MTETNENEFNFDIFKNSLKAKEIIEVDEVFANPPETVADFGEDDR